MAKKNRLSAPSGLLAILEPNGGLTSDVLSFVKDKEDYHLPEDGLVAQNIKANNKGISPQDLANLAAQDEISAVLKRIASYIAVQSKVTNEFSTVSLDTKYLKDKSSDITSKDTEAVKDAWTTVQKLLWTHPQLGIHSLLIDWMTFGKLHFCIIRKADKSIDKITVGTTAPAIQKKKLSGQKQETYYLDQFGNRVADKTDIVTLDWSALANNGVSYVHSLQRSFNMMRSVERSRIANAIMASQFRTVYTVPTKGLSKGQSRQRLSKIHSMWKRDIRLDDQSGSVTVNGNNAWPINTELWSSETGSGRPTADNPGDGNPDLNNTELIEYFAKKYYKQTGLPLSKYEAVDMSYLGDISEIDEDERQFKLTIAAYRLILSDVFKSLMKIVLADNKDYAGNTALFEAIIMTFNDEVIDEDLTEVIDKILMTLEKVLEVVDKFKALMEESSTIKEEEQTVRLAKFRNKMIAKYCPELYQYDELVEVLAIMAGETIEDIKANAGLDDTNADEDMDSDSFDNTDFNDSDASSDDSADDSADNYNVTF